MSEIDSQTPTPEEVEAHVRRADPDRWLASRLIDDANARHDVLALYALDLELARVGPSVTQPLLGEMRLAWWREGLEATARGEVSHRHPVLEALGPLLRSGRAPMDTLSALVEAHHADLEPQPFPDEAALVAHLDAREGGLMALAALALDPAARADSVRHAGRAWGWTRLLRAEPQWRERGRSWAPLDWAPAGEAVPPDTLAARARRHVAAALKAARGEVGELPVASFPAVAYVRLARDDLRDRAPGDLGKRARLLWAATLGRI